MTTMIHMQTLFPFPAIVGQEELKLSLLLNAVNPRCGGVLIRGEKGTAKSTAVRALASLLPTIEIIEGCLFSLTPEEAASRCTACRLCDRQGAVVARRVRVVTLPLNATEDRVAGGIDFEKTTRDGVRTILPGLLAQAHQGILYVDEVNLLDDHLVDVMLAAVAAGVNRIEREGVSFAHPAVCILVGTMNPEEGDLRPQFLDRFGLCVEVKAETDREMRVATMEQREIFDTEPKSFIERFASETQALAGRIKTAKSRLSKVQISGRQRALISELCTEARVAGHRADLIIEQAARALAAFSERLEVEDEDIIKVAPLALRHRRREQAPPPPPPEEKEHDHSHDDEPPEEDNEQEEEQNQDKPEEQQPSPDSKPEQDQSEADSDGATPDDSREPNEPANPDALEKVFDVGATFKVKPFTVNKDRAFRRGSGRRSRSRINGLQGRYVKSTLPRGAKDVALDATLRAAAPYQRQRQGQSSCAVVIRTEDIREKIRERRIGNFLLFVVDSSGSMGARGRMTATKGAIMSLLLDAYQKRDKVAMISFNKDEARLNLPPTSSIDMAARMLAEMPVGGRTPLNHALLKSDEVLRGQLVRDPTSRPIVVLITDGRSNVALAGGKPMDECLELARRLSREERIRFILVDTEEQGLIRFGLAAKIAEALNARYFQTADLKADTLLDLIKETS